MEQSTGATAPRVLLRFRPLGGKQTAKRCVQYLPRNEAICFLGQGSQDKVFHFDHVLGEDCSQLQVFEGLKPVIQSVLEDSVNGTILTYGQTGSGKTHTLFGNIGNHAEQGIVPRAVEELASCISKSQQDCTFSVTISVCEIYCERIRDLLDPQNDNLQVRQDKAGGIFVAELSEHAAKSEDEVQRMMQLGMSNRVVAATAMNAGSSRSHCIVFVNVAKTWKDGSDGEYSKLCLVDLAGSENPSSSAEALTIDEGKQINKSLSVLGSVVNALTDQPGRSAHIPYRDSKLTRVLQDALGGSAKTVMIICCSPCMSNASETLSSLRFGSRAKGIVNHVQASSPKRSLAEEAAKQLEDAQQECVRLRSEVAQLRAKVEQHKGGSKATVALGKPTQTAQLRVMALQTAFLMLYLVIVEDWLLAGLSGRSGRMLQK